MKFLKILMILAGLLPLISYPASAADLRGRILLSVEEAGQAWYVLPQSGERAFLGRPSDAFRIMRELGLGVSEKDFASFRDKLPDRQSGRILLRSQASGEAYYADPVSRKLVSLGRPSDAFRVMRELGLGISKNDLSRIPISSIYAEKAAQGNLYKVLKVVDGDTIDVLIGTTTTRIRIIGIDTPESSVSPSGAECFGEEAKKEAGRRLSGQSVRLEIDKTQDLIDKYGRSLRHVFFADGSSYAQGMIADGYANEYTYRGVAHAYQTSYRAAEEKARTSKIGMWEDRACVKDSVSADQDTTTSVATGLSIAYIFYDGVMNPNEADEYVRIVNDGADADLKSYQLCDLSGKCYVFPEIVLKNGGEMKVFSGCGADSSTELYWCHTVSAVWNNGGDVAYLKDVSGRIVSEYKY